MLTFLKNKNDKTELKNVILLYQKIEDKMKNNKKMKWIVGSIILLILLIICSLSVYLKHREQNMLPREQLTINDILTKPVSKISLIDQINPKEQYAVGVIVQETPLSEREKLKEKKLSEVISIYENVTGEKIPSGTIKDARQLKYKELSLESSKVLFVMTVSEEDRSIMEVYMAKYFLNPEKMNAFNNQTVGEIIDKAKKEMPELYKKIVDYNKLKKENSKNNEKKE